MTVQLQVPAQADYAALLRGTVATIAARCDLTYDRLEDARLAIDEAFAQILTFADPDAQVTCTFSEAPGALTFSLTTSTSLSSQVPTDSFAWTVLSALADDLSSHVGEGTALIRAKVQEPQAAHA